MVRRKVGATRSSTPRGLNPPGTTRPVRGKPGTRAATDVPMEVPVAVYYKRHHGPIRDKNWRGEPSPSLSELYGWTVSVDLWTFGEQVDFKIFRNPDKCEVWVNGKKLHTFRKTGKGFNDLPKTMPDDEEEEDQFEEF